MSYKNDYLFAKDGALLQPLTACLADVVDDVYVEGDGVANHAERLALAVYAGPTMTAYKRFAKEMALQLVVTMGIDANTNDAALKTAVMNIWTPYAHLMQERGVISVDEESEA